MAYLGILVLVLLARGPRIGCRFCIVCLKLLVVGFVGMLHFLFSYLGSKLFLILFGFGILIESIFYIVLLNQITITIIFFL